jgi:hypothetical protein
VFLTTRRFFFLSLLKTLLANDNYRAETQKKGSKQKTVTKMKKKGKKEKNNAFLLTVPIGEKPSATAHVTLTASMRTHRLICRASVRTVKRSQKKTEKAKSKKTKKSCGKACGTATDSLCVCTARKPSTNDTARTEAARQARPHCRRRTTRRDKV